MENKEYLTNELIFIYTYNVAYNMMKKDVIDTRLNKFLNYGVLKLVLIKHLWYTVVQKLSITKF